ncbi:uncharacterized protein LOC124817665 [Hydra vulgaris]|uniref:uncharacterized protein LOC124817665 n=1 Tax=Hydra vulgaris TaxID=6087 RepID=UPI001F5EB8F2|nr:uncharacterized protein LOC124817665 [Hydra vulgaris]
MMNIAVPSHLNDLEEVKSRSMLTGYMKEGLVLEAEKLFDKWKKEKTKPVQANLSLNIVSSEKVITNNQVSKNFCRNKVKCPEPNCKSFIVHLPRHMRDVHKKSPEEACITRGVFDLRKERKDAGLLTDQRIYSKYKCPICNKVVRRIHDHLYKSLHFLKNNLPLYYKMLKQK